VIEAVALLGRVRTIDAKAVNGAWLQAGNVAMPDFVGELGQFDALQLFGARIIEETKFDFGGIGRKEGKVDALDIPCSSAGMRKALANLEAGRESKTRFFDFGASFYYGLARIQSFLLGHVGQRMPIVRFVEERSLSRNPRMVRGYGNKFHAGNRVEPREVDPITKQGLGGYFQEM
jgi:hypothetical protein